MFISFKQKSLVAKVVKMYISKLNKKIIHRLRQLYFPSTETADRYRNLRLPLTGICLSNG